jgi:hypothetical protein
MPTVARGVHPLLSHLSRARRRAGLGAALCLLGSLACSSSSSNGPVGGLVTGPVDMHCMVNGQKIMQPVGECVPLQQDHAAGGAGGQGAATSSSGGAGGDDSGAEENAAVLYNASGDDDDCKYRVSWMSTPITENKDVMFTVTLTRLADNRPATGAQVTPEVTLDESHISPSTDIGSMESPAGSGVYKVGPIRFDQAGRWVVRFHFFEDCSDVPADSPHGHAAFFVSVP